MVGGALASARGGEGVMVVKGIPAVCQQGSTRVRDGMWRGRGPTVPNHGQRPRGNARAWGSVTGGGGVPGEVGGYKRVICLHHEGDGVPGAAGGGRGDERGGRRAGGGEEERKEGEEEREEGEGERKEGEEEREEGEEERKEGEEERKEGEEEREEGEEEREEGEEEREEGEEEREEGEEEQKEGEEERKEGEEEREEGEEEREEGEEEGEEEQKEGEEATESLRRWWSHQGPPGHGEGAHLSPTGLPPRPGCLGRPSLGSLSSSRQPRGSCPVPLGT